MVHVDPAQAACQMEILKLQAFAAFLFGLCWGSFINVCIWRLPRQISLVTPRSHCISCGTTIRWYDNIPLLSYIFLAGRCRSCGSPFSIRYFLVELLTGALFAAVLWVGRSRDLSWGAVVVQTILAGALVAASFIDADWRIIPNEITIPGMILLPILALVVPDMIAPAERVISCGIVRLDAAVSSLAGLAAGGAAIWTIGAVGKLIFRKDAMGFGDVKLMAMVGACLGWKSVLLAIVLSSFLGAAVGVVLLIRRGSHVIPYGPFLSAASLLMLLAGSSIRGFTAKLIFGGAP